MKTNELGLESEVLNRKTQSTPGADASGTTRQLASCSTGGGIDEPPLAWPHLDELGLGKELAFVRRSGIGGSDANVILSGDEGRVLRLWREKRGEIESEDLSSVLPVMLGIWTEALNRQWYEKEVGYHVTRVGASRVCESHAWRRCTLDGFVDAKNAVFEAKHVGAFYKSEEVLTRYMPQLQHNMAVTGAKVALLSVIFGNHKWEVFEIASDWLYQEELLIAETRFWNCVCSGEAPVPAPVPATPAPVDFREMCLEGHNSWATAAADWLECRDAAGRHKTATSILKDLVEPDVSRAFGHGVEIRRNRAGALSIREMAP